MNYPKNEFDRYLEGVTPDDGDDEENLEWLTPPAVEPTCAMAKADGWAVTVGTVLGCVLALLMMLTGCADTDTEPELVEEPPSSVWHNIGTGRAQTLYSDGPSNVSVSVECATKVPLLHAPMVMTTVAGPWSDAIVEAKGLSMGNDTVLMSWRFDGQPSKEVVERGFRVVAPGSQAIAVMGRRASMRLVNMLMEADLLEYGTPGLGDWRAWSTVGAPAAIEHLHCYGDVQ